MPVRNGDENMGINLEKGGTINLNKCIDLSKRPQGLNKVTVGLGWDVNTGYGADYDLDAMAGCLNSNGVLASGDSSFIYFGHKQGRGLYLTGDNLTGEGDGDDEQIVVNLNDIPADVSVISFAVIIYSARSRGQYFGKVRNAYIRVVDDVSGKELVRYNLTDEFHKETGVIVGELERDTTGGWKFNAIGHGLMNATHTTLKQDYASTGGSSNGMSNNSYSSGQGNQKTGFFGKLFGR